jgi:hypothetical protein
MCHFHMAGCVRPEVISSIVPLLHDRTPSGRFAFSMPLSLCCSSLCKRQPVFFSTHPDSAPAPLPFRVYGPYSVFSSVPFLLCGHYIRCLACWEPLTQRDVISAYQPLCKEKPVWADRNWGPIEEFMCSVWRASVHEHREKKVLCSKSVVSADRREWLALMERRTVLHSSESGSTKRATMKWLVQYLYSSYMR